MTLACNKKTEQTLDNQLVVALDAVSGGNGLSHFMLPSSGDFVNIPQDPKNPLTEEKVSLGQLLYHETALATRAKLPDGMNTYSCASCHHAAAGFQAGRIQGIADGGSGFGYDGGARDIHAAYPADSMDVQPIRTPTVLNGAYSDVMLWNGQFGATGTNHGTEASWTPGTPKEVNTLGYEGMETQAIAGLTVHRMAIDTAVLFPMGYQPLFDAAFSDVPVAERYNSETAGLAIAAYERTILANQSPFQEWLRGNQKAMGDAEKSGALLFFGEAGCYQCHNGPALSGMSFEAIGMKDLEGYGVYGPGVDDGTQKGRGGFTGNEKEMYCFKVPQLYSLGYSPFYGHGGSFTTLRSVVEYKNEAQPENTDVPAEYLSDMYEPLSLSEEEIDQLTAFLENGLNDSNLDRYVPASLPSGNCFPNNDAQSRIDLGCD